MRNDIPTAWGKLDHGAAGTLDGNIGAQDLDVSVARPGVHQLYHFVLAFDDRLAELIVCITILWPVTHAAALIPTRMVMLIICSSGVDGQPDVHRSVSAIVVEIWVI